MLFSRSLSCLATWARMRTDSLLKSPFHVKGIAFVLCSSKANRIFSKCLLKIKITHFQWAQGVSGSLICVQNTEDVLNSGVKVTCVLDWWAVGPSQCWGLKSQMDFILSHVYKSVEGQRVRWISHNSQLLPEDFIASFVTWGSLSDGFLREPSASSSLASPGCTTRSPRVGSF